MKKTKIVCTLGPSTDDDDVLRKMMKAGMNVARLNFSHGTHEDHAKKIEQVRRIRTELDIPVAILLDTKGPEIRTKTFENGKAELKEGQLFTLIAGGEEEGTNESVAVTYERLHEDLHIGATVLIDDGLIGLKVENIEGSRIICRVLNGGVVANRKSLNIPDVNINMTYVSHQDESDVIFGIRHGVDYIAASFVRSAEDVYDIRRILEKNGGDNIHIIAKIENAQGVGNIDDIIRASDGIMVARGDMGVEIALEMLPKIQKTLIKKAYTSGKKVITATQMLESMIKNPRPTRAEATDIANAVYDGTSAVMLSGETAVGAYPVEAVRTMARIIERTESDVDYIRLFENMRFDTTKSVTDAISHATCTTAHDLGATAIITVTKTGETARNISKFRPSCPIVGCTTDETAYRQLALSWGIIPVMATEKTTTDELFEHVVERALATGTVSNGDLVVITAGVPLGISGTTNILKVHIVGDVLASGAGVNPLSVCGRLCVCKNEEDALRDFRDGDILVIPSTSNDIMRLLKKAGGIITEMGGASSHAAIVGLTLEIPTIVDARHATDLLKNGTTVTLDGARGIVYSGVTRAF